MEIDINMVNLQRSPLSTLFGDAQEKSLVGFFSTSGILFSEGRVKLKPFGQRVWKSINSKKGPEYFRSELSQATHKVHLRLELILTTLSLYLNTAAWMGYYKDAITLLALPRSNPSVHTFRFWAPISANLIASGKQE